MNTVQEKAKAANTKKTATKKRAANANLKKVEYQEKTTVKVENSTNENEAKKIEVAQMKVADILNPSADARIKKLETFNRLAEKKQKIDTKLDELVNFNASNDGTLSKMEFSADNNYRFTISNPLTIGKILISIQDELMRLQEATEKEIVEFHI
jgi:hypothetical protein